MKKILLIVGMILCVAVVGSVFAVAVYNASSSATVTADTYINLGWNGTSSAAITVESGKSICRPVTLTVTKSANAGATGTFTLTCADDTANSKNLNNVTITVCTDSEGEHEVVSVANGITVTNSGNNWTIAGITQTTTYYVFAAFKANATASEVSTCGGTMTLSFTAVEAA